MLQAVPIEVQSADQAVEPRKRENKLFKKKARMNKKKGRQDKIVNKKVFLSEIISMAHEKHPSNFGPHSSDNKRQTFGNMPCLKILVKPNKVVVIAKVGVM